MSDDNTPNPPIEQTEPDLSGFTPTANLRFVRGILHQRFDHHEGRQVWRPVESADGEA